MANNTVPEKIFDEPTASKLEAEREDTRAKGNGVILYDCIHAAVGQGFRVSCRKGHTLSTAATDGMVALVSVLRGRTPKICRACQDGDFDTEAESQSGR